MEFEERKRKLAEEIDTYLKAIESAEAALTETETMLDNLPEEAWENASADPEDDADWVIIF